MAKVAVITTFDMTWMLAWCGNAVMATLAGTDDGKVIDLDDGRPLSRAVAKVAVAGHADMLTGHGARLYSTRIRMTLIAATRGTGEHTLQVATFAF